MTFCDTSFVNKESQRIGQRCVEIVQCMHMIHSNAHDVRNVFRFAIKCFYRMISFQTQIHRNQMSVDRFNG